jgi:hypothetical protein
MENCGWEILQNLLEKYKTIQLQHRI